MLRKRMLSLALVAGLAVFGAACEAEDEPAIDQDIQEQPADQTDLGDESGDIGTDTGDTGTDTGDTGTDTGDTGTDTGDTGTDTGDTGTETETDAGTDG